ncbi:IPT/TIG domain-containing protein [Arthrobacter crystallopoietes]|uniref:IPT/TIG domain-containing protein n=1 Tax=Crystallibacter crystallopoietes TaxID=37928 RepID=UPI0011113572|nr:IPT/TIG domain-containing protein [Arthrobacter crystallopoietes]
MKRLASALLAGALIFGGSTAIAAPVQASPVVQVMAAKTVKTAVTSHPKSLTAVQGSTVKFSVSARGTSLKYQWYKKAPGAKAWSKVSRATSRTLSLSKVSTTASKTQYRVLVTGRAGKVYSKAATLTVRKAYKPTITALSTYSTITGKPRAITITGTHFHDVSRVYVDGIAVGFKKTGTTKLSITVPASWLEEKVWITVASATGKSSKAFTYFTPLSSGDRADYLFDLDWMQRNMGAPQAPVKAAYDAAVKYIKSSGAHEEAAYKQYLIASNAIDYTYLIKEADAASVEYGEMKVEHEKALRSGDTAAAEFFKGLMEDWTWIRDTCKEDAAKALGNIRALGGKIG